MSPPRAVSPESDEPPESDAEDTDTDVVKLPLLGNSAAADVESEEYNDPEELALPAADARAAAVVLVDATLKSTVATPSAKRRARCMLLKSSCSCCVCSRSRCRNVLRSDTVNRFIRRRRADEDAVAPMMMPHALTLSILT